MRHIRQFIGLGLVAALALVPRAHAEGPRPRNELQLWLRLNGSPTSTTQTQSTSPTAATITEDEGDVILLQCDVAIWYRVDGTASDSTGIKLAAGEKAYIVLPDSDATISILAVSGTATCTSSVMQ